MKRAYALAAFLAVMVTIPAAENDSMNALAERYVKLVLALGQHDADYVDAYYGPPQWQKDAEGAKRPLAEIDRDAAAVEAALAAAKPAQSAEEILRLRHEYLTKQLSALRARVSMLAGKTLTFDEESKALYDAVAPTHADSEFDAALNELESRLPGQGALSGAQSGRAPSTFSSSSPAFPSSRGATSREPESSPSVTEALAGAGSG